MKKFLLALVVVGVIAAGAIYYLNQDNGSTPTDQAIAKLLSKKYNRPVETVQVEVRTDSEKFAKGTVRFSGENGGGLWFAAKPKGDWELAYDGNGIIPCETADKYSLPKDIAPKCIDTKNNSRLIDR